MPESPITALLDLMAKLRDPDGGCPWDVEQTYATIAPHTIEEAYEVAEAIERGDMAHLQDELGDLLFQVVFYAQMGREDGHFDFDSITRGITDKMIRRHPHVFGDAIVPDAEAQTKAWEEQKAKERKTKAEHGALDGVSTALPALTRAHKLQKRAARVGFDWPDVQGVLDKLDEETAELKAEITQTPDPQRVIDEVGDLLFTAVNVARHLDIDPETALRHANHRFEDRFRAMEHDIGDFSQSSLEEMDSAWNRAKMHEKEA